MKLGLACCCEAPVRAAIGSSPVSTMPLGSNGFGDFHPVAEAVFEGCEAVEEGQAVGIEVGGTAIKTRDVFQRTVGDEVCEIIRRRRIGSIRESDDVPTGVEGREVIRLERSAAHFEGVVFRRRAPSSLGRW